ncbi:MAG: hypothetical protein J7K68_06315 [Candidatus Diapherotrites archaeon]|nr:hypothetical protein [Candidatus Diapherotrites archaeon]
MKIKKPWGYVEVIEQNPEFELSKIVLYANKTIPKHYHRIVKEIIIDEKGNIDIWKEGEVHEYDNKGKKKKAMICIRIPGNQPADEYLV